MAIIIDTETTGLPATPSIGRFYRPELFEVYNQARVIQIAWQVVDIQTRVILREYQTVVKPHGAFEINPAALAIHGITKERIEAEGVATEVMLGRLNEELKKTHLFVAHNLNFDLHVIASEIMRAGHSVPPNALVVLWRMQRYCTMRRTTALCGLKTKRGRPKWPKLVELYAHLFDGRTFQGGHDAMNDVRATSASFVKLLDRSVWVC